MIDPKTLKQIEEFTGPLLEFPGKKTGVSYRPIRAENKKSTKIWAIFFSNPDGNVIQVGNFETGENRIFKIKSDISSYASSYKPPSKKEYVKKRDSFSIRWEKAFREKQKKNCPHLKNYDIPPSGYYIEGKGYFPYCKFPETKISAVQTIDKEKKFTKGSETEGAVHVIRPPRDKNSLIYITEGIKSGYAAALESPKSAGIMAAGSIHNIEKAVLNLKAGGYNRLVLCAEKKGFDRYELWRDRHQILMIGSKEWDDLDDLFIKTDREVLKAFVTTFRDKNFVPIGLNSKGHVGLYIKGVKLISFYKKTDAEICFSDCYDTLTPPKAKEAKEHYFYARKLCREVGLSAENIYRLYYGIHPLKENFLFYDQKWLYLIKNEKIVKLDKDSTIFKDIVLAKYAGIRQRDLTKLNPLDKREIAYIEETGKLFSFGPDIENKMILGWIVQGLLCGGLKYRSPLWITSDSFAGKGELSKRFIFQCFPVFERMQGRTTTPRWLCRFFNGKSIPLHRDEYEPSKSKSRETEEEMEFVRNSATERFPKRGIAAGLDDTTNNFIYCFTALYSSIQRPKLTSGDIGRFVFIELLYVFKENFEKKLKKFQNFMNIENKHRLLVTSMLKLHKIRKNYEELMNSDELSKIRTHKKSSVITLACCYNAVFNGEITIAEMQNYLNKMETQKGFEGYSKMLYRFMFAVCEQKAYPFLMESINIIYLIKKMETDPFNQAANADELKIKAFLNDWGIYLYKDSLLIDCKKGVVFIHNILKNDIKNIVSNLSQDGDFLINPRFKIGENDKNIPRRTYLRFDWNKIKEAWI